VSTLLSTPSRLYSLHPVDSTLYTQSTAAGLVVTDGENNHENPYTLKKAIDRLRESGMKNVRIVFVTLGRSNDSTYDALAALETRRPGVLAGDRVTRSQLPPSPWLFSICGYGELDTSSRCTSDHKSKNG
jgi:hypothetical protein